MADVPKQPEQTQEQQQYKTPSQPTRTTSQATPAAQHTTKELPSRSQPTKARTSSIRSTNFTRSSNQRHSKTLLSYPLDTQKEVTKPQLAGIAKPSIHFARKCRAEFLTLLDSIKPDYHNDIRNLLEDETYPDLHIKIGDVELKRPLHKCIIASRAFKLYCALRGFKVSNSSAEEDIIIAELQKSYSDIEQASADQSSEVEDKAVDNEDHSPDPEWAQKKAEQLQEASEVLFCELPDGLLNPDILSNFARRAYLDTDLTEDEIQLQSPILTWLKVNKPELIKVANPNRPSLDHRESFRTIRPDFEQLSVSGNSPAMSVGELSGQDIQRVSEATSAADLSQTYSIKDENQAVTSLTRTETFEMLPRGNLDPNVSDGAKEGDSTLDVDDKDQSELSVNTSESSELYTPVTRTGLKPKQFTPIVAIKSVTANKISTPRKPTDGVSSQGGLVKGTQGSDHQAPGISTNTPSAATKRSSITSAISPSPESSTSPAPGRAAQSMIKSKTGTTTANRAAPPKVRQTIITRAHPISLERSQSPATNLSKGSTKNFIAANKKMISQLEKKAASIHQGELTSQTNDDSENEVSDASLLTLTEPLSTDNLAAHLDKFALVSLSKLAEALSSMFIGGVLTDVVVLAKDNKEINAHKCILASRSAYLNDQITKLSLPSMTTETLTPSKQLIKIDLTEYSYPAVYFSMMHIYSAIVKVPEDLELEELTKMSHLLHVGTLRQVCMHNLKMNYCHYFHKPCNVCCIGVLKTLPLAWRYDLTELYSMCLQWIGAHFGQIFCLEEFSNLKPRDLIEECYKETSSQLTPDNVIQKTIECQKLLKSLPRVKWTESVICLVGRQLEDFCHYVADNYEKIIQSESFLNLGKSCWECEVLEENLLAAMSHLKPDSGCKTLIQLDKLECSLETYCDEPRTVSETFANLISKMRKYCERYLLKEAAAVVHCSSWRMMSPSLQKKIKDQALIATDFDEPARHLSSKPRLPSMSRHQQQSSSKSSPSPQPNNSTSEAKSSSSPGNRSSPVPRLKSPNTTYLPPPKTKPAAARHVKVLK